MFDNKYPYTDYHEMNLDWFLEKFKEYYTQIDSQNQKIATMEETVEQFTTFVTNYFDNLDVQQEINNKLDAMAASGELQAMLQPYFDGFVEAVNDQINTQNGRINQLDARMDTFASLTEGSTTGDAELMDIRVAYDGETYPTAGDAVRAQGGGANIKIDRLGELFGTKIPLSNYTSVTSGSLIRFSGNVTSRSGMLTSITVKSKIATTTDIYFGILFNYKYTYITKVNVTLKAGINILVNGRDFVLNTKLPKNTVVGVVSGVCYYYSNGTEKSFSIDPSNVETTASVYSTTSYGVSISAIVNEIDDRLLNLEDVRPVYRYEYADTLSNDSMLINKPYSYKKNMIISMFGTITAFDTLDIGVQSSGTVYDFIRITNTQIISYSVYNPGGTTYNHSLAIDNNISVIIATNYEDNADITLMSNGEIFTVNVAWERMIVPQSPYLTVPSTTTLTDVKLNITCGDYDGLIYAYGDSYFNADDTRWMYYAVQDGLSDNMLINAFPGESSPSAANMIAEDITHGKPKYILWCLGMNDGSDTSTYPSLWKSSIDIMLNYCEAINAIPVLATIPTVATNGTVTRNNEKKNDWIRASGYRYIDFAEAVGAGADGVWYDGMLEPAGGRVTERVHPTAKGARALFMKACVDFPELFIK